MSTQFDVTAPDGTQYHVEGPDGATEQDALAQVQAQHQAASTPPAAPAQPSYWDRFKTGAADALAIPATLAQGATALGEGALHLGSQVAAFPVEGAASAYQLATSPAGLRVRNANAAVDAVGRAMTYQPRTTGGQIASGAADTVLSLPAKGADYVGQKVTDATGSAGAGATTSLALQSVPVLLGARYAAGKAAKARAAATAPPAMTPAERAEAYVNSRTALDWNSLTDAFKEKITTIAQSATDLSKLDPDAVARQARLDKLQIPATRGTIERSLPQLTTEENLSKSEAGAPIRDIMAQQDQRLHDLVSALRNPTSPTTRQGVGTAVQSAAISKQAVHNQAVSAAYDSARAAGETAQLADVEPLRQWLKEPANSRNAGFLRSALKDYAPEEGQGVTINDLENIRKEAVAKTLGPPSTEGHYAGQAVGVIDNILDNSGGDKYKAARALYKAGKSEFDRQKLMRDMVSDKSGTTDRATALEDTFDRVIRSGSAEQLKQFKDSLTTGGTTATRAAGASAWQALQGATIDYLRSAAAGKRAIPGEKGQLQFNSTFLDALHELDADGKLDTIFGIQKAKQVREIAQAVRDVRTKPAGRIAGSDTAARIISTLERVSNIPVAGPLLSGTVKAAQKLYSMGQEGRSVTNALSSPIDEQAAATQSSTIKSARARRVSNALGRYGPAAGIAGSESRR